MQTNFRIFQAEASQGSGGDATTTSEMEVEFISTPVIIAWLPVVNLAVIIAAMRWHKFSFYIHLILGLIVIGLSLGFTIPFIMVVGIEYKADDPIQKVHNYAGVVILAWMGIEAITGILARVIQYSIQVTPNFCLWTKRIHRFSGYLLILAAKFDYFNMMFLKNQLNPNFFALLFADIFSVILYFFIKFKYWTLGQEIIDNQLIDKNKNGQSSRATWFDISLISNAKNLFRSITQDSFNLPKIKQVSTHYNSQSQIQLSCFVIFNDFVYDTKNFKERHPGGQRIISLVNKREVDRFLYGCYGPQLQPTVKAYNHSQDCLRLCGEPVAKIDRISPMRGFQRLNKCQMVLCDQVANPSDIYLIYLKPQGIELFFGGFEQENQIGQYFTLTLTNEKGRQRCTRLYTTIWCMRPQNIKIMQKNFPFQKFSQKKQYQQQHQIKEEISNIELFMKDHEKIPLIIKRYEKGKLTPKLFAENNNGTIILSEPMGAGLKYDTIAPTGSVIFVCGGTGILPFCDFIDLLFKRNKVLEGSNLSGMLIKNDPLVGKDFIKQRSFVFYCAIENATDLPAMTIYQLNNLCKSNELKFTCVMRVKNGKEMIENNYKSISFQNGYFTKNIKEKIKEGNISQVYICGPPAMNSDVGKIMVEDKVSPLLYHFV